MITTDGTSVVGVAPGLSAVLFVGEADIVLDFLHIWVAQADSFGDSTLLVGDEILISIDPYAANQPLLGNFALTYDTSTDAVAIVPDPVPGWYRVLARHAGTATLTFSGLDLSKTWSIEVLP